MPPVLSKQYQDIKRRGMSQSDLVGFLENVMNRFNEVQRYTLYGIEGNPALAISTNFNVLNNNAVPYKNGGVFKTLAQFTVFSLGTTQTIAATQWSAALLTVNAAGTTVATWATAGSYATEVLAIAALTDVAATDTVVGYVTVQAGASTWTAGTSALQGGTGGTPATTTNYYNSINPNGLMFGAALSLLRN